MGVAIVSKLTSSEYGKTMKIETETQWKKRDIIYKNTIFINGKKEHIDMSHVILLQFDMLMVLVKKIFEKDDVLGENGGWHWK